MVHRESSPFARRLIALRKKAGLRQEDVAKMLQVHRTTYTKYETDITTPDPAGLLRLATLFGVTVDYLVGREPVDEDTPHEAFLQDGPRTLQLDAQEQQLLLLFRGLSEEERARLVQQLDADRHPQ